MDNQMMERSLTWAGYDASHVWGESGHNQKHASQIFPDVLRWLWRDWQTNIEVKANPKGESKWRGYEVVVGEWSLVGEMPLGDAKIVRATKDGMVVISGAIGTVREFTRARVIKQIAQTKVAVRDIEPTWSGKWLALAERQDGNTITAWSADFQTELESAEIGGFDEVAVTYSDCGLLSLGAVQTRLPSSTPMPNVAGVAFEQWTLPFELCILPDQTQAAGTGYRGNVSISSILDPMVVNNAPFYQLESFAEPPQRRLVPSPDGLCVDNNGWLYVAASLGIQVLYQVGRVNFIIPTPKQSYDVCFGGKDLSELFIACGDTIYKRPTKARGVVSGQQQPIKPAPPKL